jgi:protein gp37
VQYLSALSYSRQRLTINYKCIQYTVLSSYWGIEFDTSMAKNSKIEWTHHTFNPWWGCERVSPACKHCYAETWARRLGLDLWSKGAPRRMLSSAYWRQPLAWDREARESGVRSRVFCASMADVFESRSDLNPVREQLWETISSTPNLDWLLLTKRPQHVSQLVPWGQQWPHNVWLGTTVETQRWADRRAPLLLEHAAVVRFVSCEPLLGPIDLTPWLNPSKNSFGINWVIVGGESGHRARPMNPVWARHLRDQCEAYDVGFHFKQWGNWSPSDGLPNGHRTRILNGGTALAVSMTNVGKKESGRKLDGYEWNGLPLDHGDLMEA